MTKNPETISAESSIDTAAVTGEISAANEGTSWIQSDSWTGNQADQTRPFFDAASQINPGGSQEGSRDASRIRETESLGGWARANSCLIDPKEIDGLPLISNSTSEHEVHYRQSDRRAVKRTWPGVYGQIPIPNNGRLDRANATPSEYLIRQALQVAVFGSDIRLEGVSISDKLSMVLFEPPGQPSFVISQEWFEGGKAPTMGEIAERLDADGFFSAPHSYFGWYRPVDGVVIVDAKPDNFVKTPAGVVPIDLQMAVFTPKQLKEAGLVDPCLAKLADPIPLVQKLNSLS
jgi:hypothetical protein